LFHEILLGRAAQGGWDGRDLEHKLRGEKLVHGYLAINPQNRLGIQDMDRKVILTLIELIGFQLLTSVVALYSRI
jgi:hypothetical protein